MEKSEYLFDDTKYKGIYRDDGIAVFNGDWKKRNIVDWLDKFQSNVDICVGSEHLQFTAEVWGADKNDSTASKKVKVIKSNSFPYLDLELFWKKSELQFRIHKKPNQQLKYLNKGSCHTKATFRAIPGGVFGRFGKLTSQTEETNSMTVDKIYPEQCKALQHAGLAPKSFPTLAEVVDANKQAEEKKKEKKPNNARSRQTYFCVGLSKYWKEPIHAIINRTKKKHNLPWLRVSMSYKKFANLREIFSSDLNSKLMKGITSLDFADRPCNCTRSNKFLNGECVYKSNCRKKMVIYMATCKFKDCNCFYIGNTQQCLKKRMEGHYNDVKQKILYNKSSDSFADHFASHFANCRDITPHRIRKCLDMTILWQGNAISCMKSFGRLDCTLCMQERLHILKNSTESPTQLINTSNEIYGACRHKTRFHRYSSKTTTPDTDDAHAEKRSNQDKLLVDV